MKKYKVMQIGVGDHGKKFANVFLPHFINNGRIEVVAVVAPSQASRDYAKAAYGLPESSLFADYHDAFKKTDADFVINVAPPEYHEDIVDCACAKKMDIFSEKPIADSLLGSARVALKVKKAGIRMAMNMSFRYEQEYYTIARLLASGKFGRLNYMVGSLTADCRKFGSWGTPYRHKIDEPVLIDGILHQLDIYNSIAGAPCETVYCQSWNPEWGSFKNGSNVLLSMKYENGVRAQFETAKTNAVGLHHWSIVGPYPGEYHRFECEKATVIMNRREIEYFEYDPERMWRQEIEGNGIKVKQEERELWGNQWNVERYLDWLDGGSPIETNVDANLQAMALIYSAIESGQKNEVIHVQEKLKDAIKEAETQLKGKRD